MKGILAVCMALALAGCGAKSQNDMQRLALNTYIRCLHSAARAMDDHRSDASAIAEAAAEKCSREHNAARAALSYAPPEISAAITIVLDERNKAPN